MELGLRVTGHGSDPVFDPVLSFKMRVYLVSARYSQGPPRIRVLVLRLYPNWNRCRSQARGKFFFTARCYAERGVYCSTQVVRL